MVLKFCKIIKDVGGVLLNLFLSIMLIPIMDLCGMDELETSNGLTIKLK